MMNYGIVYEWEEKSTGKKYIGSTIRPTKRFKDHIDANSNSYFHQRIRELGLQGDYEKIKEYFNFQILERYEIADNKEEVRNILNEREQYYINLNDCIFPNGFNKQRNIKKVKCFKLTEEQKNKAEINRKTDRKTSIKKINFVYEFLEDEIVRKSRIERNIESLKRYRESEEYKKYLEESHKRRLEKEAKEKQAKIDYWNSEEGKAHLKRNKEKHSRIITEYNKSEEHRKIVIENNKKKRKRVGEYSTEGELIKIYDSITQAAEYKHLVKGAIGACLKGRTKTSRGSIWKYID